MFAVSVIVSVLLCVDYSKGLHKVQCNNDDECRINAITLRVYPKFIAGLDGVERSDPLHIDTIVADQPTFKYSLHNASLTGLMGCEFSKLIYNPATEYTLFEYSLECPEVSISGDYELNGSDDAVPAEGKGAFKVVYSDYHYSFTGKQEKIKDDKEKLHLRVIEYTIKPTIKGEIKHLEYANLVTSNKEMDDSRFKLLEKTTRDKVLDTFMNKFVQNLKSFHQHVPIEDLHFKYV